MKIIEKPHKATRKSKSYHWWLGIEEPRKKGRLSQLQKHNKRKPSEFVKMAEALDERY